MAEKLLKSVLCCEIAIEKCVKWLQYGAEQDDIFTCSRAEFTLYLISLIRHQTQSILQFNSLQTNDISLQSAESKEPFANAPSNLITPKQESGSTSAQKNPRVSRRICTEYFPKGDDEEKLPLVEKGELKDLENDFLLSPINDSSKNLSSVDSDSQSNVSKEHDVSSTPLKEASLDKECLFSPVNPADRSNRRSANIMFSTPNSSINLSHNSHSHVDHSRNASPSLNSSQHARYHNHPRTYSPQIARHPNQQNVRFSQWRNADSFHSADSFNSPRMDFSRPSSSRTNICIGDFIVNRTAGSEKSTGKKKKFVKYVNLSMEDDVMMRNDGNRSVRDDTSQLDLKDDNSFPKIGSTTQNRRRINPTRLNSTNPELSSSLLHSDASLQFGVKYDKTEQNEAFARQVFQVKEETSSYNAERAILKAEKDKLLEKFSSKNQAKPIKILTRHTPSKENKKMEIFEYVMPDPKLVTCVKPLEVLADLYSVILHCNLVTNITSEISFLISILVSQQIITNKNKDVKISSELENATVDPRSTEKSVNTNSDLVNKMMEKCALDENIINDNSNQMDSCFEVQSILSTVHNCVYFAVRTLERQLFTLDVIFDQGALRLMQDNARIRSFCPWMADHCTRLYAAKLKTKQDLDVSSGILNKNVCFNTDTDSAENFPTLQCFYSFKKQRDLFYDIFRLWESGHTRAGWNSASRLGSMIRTLLNLGSSASNMAHLARLLREQLLSAPTQTKLPDSLADWDLGKVNANRLSKLAERLTTKSVSHEDTFPQHQEFFRDFIILADSGAFRQHLTDSMIQEICRLDQTAFLSSENEETDVAVDIGTRIQFLHCVRSLQVLAKFLGFLLALAYGGAHSSLPAKEQVLNCEIAVRDQTQPSIDLIKIVNNSRKNKRLVLTIPWVVHYLAMLDYSTIRLSYYRHLIFTLFEIYAQTSLESMRTSQTDLPKCHLNMTANSRTLLKLMLGWLFDMPQFPQESFYLWLKEIAPIDLVSANILETSDGSKQTLQDLDESADDLNKAPKGLNETPDNLNQGADVFDQTVDSASATDVGKFSLRVDSADSCLDGLDIVDGNVILALCPFLKEFRSILSSVDSGASDKPKTFRHITPITSSFSEDKTKNREKQIQLQLEEWFLGGQPKSILRAVGERVSAALVRLLRAQLPALRHLAYSGAYHILKDPSSSNPELSIAALHSSLLRAFLARGRRAGGATALARCTRALRGLLPPGAAESRRALGRLAARRVLRALATWLAAHSDAITADWKADIEKLKQRVHRGPMACQYEEITAYLDAPKLEEDGSDKSPSEEAGDVSAQYYSVTDIVIDLKAMCLDLVTSQTDTEVVRSSLSDHLSRCILCSRCDYVQVCTKRTVGQLTVDIAMLLVALHPSILSPEILAKFKTTWLQCLQNKILLDDVIKLPFSRTDTPNIDDDSDEVELFEKMMFGDTKIQSFDDANSSADSDERSESDVGCSGEFFNSILCPRNVLFMGQLGRSEAAVWDKLTEFLIFLLKEKFLTEDSLTEQCLAIYRQDWAQPTLDNLAACIRNVAAGRKFSSEKSRLFLNFLAEFCLDLGDLDLPEAS